MTVYRILGVGIGTFILATCWTLALLLCLFFSKAKGNLGTATGCIVCTTLLSSILILLQQRSGHQEEEEDSFTDPLFIGRVLLLIFMGVSSVLCLVLMLMSQVETQRAFRIPDRRADAHAHKITRSEPFFNGVENIQ